MNDLLIDQLASELKPTPRRALTVRLLLGLTAGSAVSLLGVFLMLGLRPDMGQAVFGPMFWIKLAYTGALGGVGLWCSERLSRPGGQAKYRWPFLAVPFAVIAAMALYRLTISSPGQVHGLLMGSSAQVCPWLILATAGPIYLGLAWAIRGLAPTDLKTAGAAAGLAAGGAGAFVYALHCPEAASPFIAVWYTLGVLMACVLGALMGPLLLRWTDRSVDLAGTSGPP